MRTHFQIEYLDFKIECIFINFVYPDVLTLDQTHTFYFLEYTGEPFTRGMCLPQHGSPCYGQVYKYRVFLPLLYL